MPATDPAKMEKDQKYTIEDAPEKTQEQEEKETPAYFDNIDLSAEDKLRLSKGIFEEFDEIKSQYDKEGYINKWASLDNQYEGVMADNPNQLFNLHKPTTKVKVDAITRFLMKAYFGSDPIYSVTPRPEFYKEGGQDVCDRQQDYLDSKLDHGGIPFRPPMTKTLKTAVLKNGGILKITHEYVVEQKKRPEFYEGNPIFLVERSNAETGEPYQFEVNLDDLEAMGMNQESPEILGVSNMGLDEFLQAYPDGRKTYPGYVSKLENGKKIDIIVEYEEITYNDPLPKYVEPKNFFVRTTTNGYDGLKITRLIIERESYNWWELMREQRKGKFYDIDQLAYQYDDSTIHVGGKVSKKKDDKALYKAGHETLQYDILRCTYYFKIKESDEEESRIVCWLDEESERVIGGIMYPYYTVDCVYIPFFAKSGWPGFWQPGVAQYMTDTNVAENAILNFSLEAAFMRNTITPITKNQDIINQFIEKSFAHGSPLEAAPNEVDFLQNYMQQIDTRGLMGMLEMLTKSQGDVSGVPSIITGRESELDPRAPAEKTIALMKSAGINIEEYIENMLPAFNMVAEIILKITHQMSEEGRKFRARPSRVVDGNPFSEISRQDMIARTNIQSQAMAVAFDKHSEKQEDLALFATLRQEPLIARNPEAVYILLKNMLKGWSPKWRNQWEELLPDLQQFRQDQLKIANEAVTNYMKQAAVQAQATGKRPEFNPQEVVTIMNEAMARAATNPSPEIQKKEAKEAEKAQKGG